MTTYYSARQHRHRHRRRSGRLVVAAGLGLALSVGAGWVAHARGADDSDRVEPAIGTAATNELPGGCAAGPAHKAAEKYLAANPGYGAATVDGAPSAQECAAITKLQARFDVKDP